MIYVSFFPLQISIYFEFLVLLAMSSLTRGLVKFGNIVICLTRSL